MRTLKTYVTSLIVAWLTCSIEYNRQLLITINITIRCLSYTFNTCALEQLRLFTDVHAGGIDIGLVLVIMA